MRASAELAGKAKVALSDDRWAKRLAGASFTQSVDGWSTMTVAVAMAPKELRDAKLADYPSTAELEWNSRALFRGNLVAGEVRGASQLVLTYGDDLRLVGKRTTDGFGKKQSLEELLRKLATGIGMRPRFLGSFAEELPSFPQGGRTQLDVLLALAEQQGFFFVTRSVSDEIVFFRPGEHVARVAIDASAQASSTVFGQSSEGSFERIALRYFDVASQAPKEASLGRDALYGPIAGYTESSTFRDKFQWKASQGEFEAHVTERSGFERAPSWLSAHFSKRALLQERATVVCHEPVALPGDRLDLSKSSAPALADGAYLVTGLRVDVGASIPRGVLSLARA
jgi:hypothetical protein